MNINNTWTILTSYVGLLEGNLFLMYQSLSPIDFEMWYVFFFLRVGYIVSNRAVFLKRNSVRKTCEHAGIYDALWALEFQTNCISFRETERCEHK